MRLFKKNELLAIIVLLPLLMSCRWASTPSALPAPPTPVLPTILSSAPLTADNVSSWKELTQLHAANESAIAAVVFTLDSQELLATQLSPGGLHRWRVQEQTLIQSLVLGEFGVTASSFSQDGRLVAAAGGNILPARQADLAAMREGVQIWDTATGAILYQTTLGSAPPTFIMTDVALSADGRRVADLDEGGWSVHDISTGREAESTVFMPFERKPDGAAPILTAIAFDPSGEWIACADDNGQIIYNNITYNDPNQNIMTFSNHDAQGTPVALAFDPTRRYLALVLDKAFVLGKLQSFTEGPFILRFSSPTPAAGLTFSPDGALVAFSTAAGWQVWSVEERIKLFEEPTGAFALAFSPNAHLLAVGDKEGVIHLWGVP